MKFVAEDGVAFDTAEECATHEKRAKFLAELEPLLDMSEAQVQAILRGEDEARLKLIAKVVRATREPKPRRRRSPEERAADIEARLAKLTAGAAR
jgi:hypothetical protein